MSATAGTARGRVSVGHIALALPVIAAVISGCIGQYQVIPAGSGVLAAGSCLAYDGPGDRPPAAVQMSPIVSAAVAA